jgi:hypothetical protein
MTGRPIARKRVDKHVSMEKDSWKQTRYWTRFRGYEWSTNIFLDMEALYERSVWARHQDWQTDWLTVSRNVTLTLSSDYTRVEAG